ncbi:MAG: diguanylate cyclase [Gallionellaceae bacterium]|nr:diguanylate cyclase [Gallionellaceae bacterium]
MKRVRDLKLSFKFIGAISIILVTMTVMDIVYNADREQKITQKAILDWSFLFAENVRVTLNTLMREGRMNLRPAIFSSMSKELKGLKDVHVIRSIRTNELFKEVNEKEVVPLWVESKQSLTQEMAELGNALNKAKNQGERQDISQKINNLERDIYALEKKIAEALKVKELEVYERPRDALDEEVLKSGQPVSRFSGDNARVLIPYTVKKEGCAEKSGCHQLAKEGEVLGAISLEFSIEEINKEIKRNNFVMALIWILRLATILAVIALLVNFIITRNLHGMLAVFKRLSDGDLSVRVPVKGGDEVGLLATGFNKMATSLEETKKELDRRLLEIYALYNVSKTLNATFETEQMLLSLVKSMSKGIHIDKILIMIRDKEKNELYVASQTGFKDTDTHDVRYKFGQGFYGQIASVGKSRVINDVSREPSVTPDELFGSATSSILAVPFLRRGEVLGLICAFKDEPDKFEPNHISLFDSVAEHLAIAFENARLFEETKKMAITDGLTGLYNKRCLLERFDMELARSKRNHKSLSYLMMDIDNFKHYNDTNGHPAGDALLKEMAILIKASIRQTDVPFRYGGEELVVLLPDTGKKDAIEVAEKLVKAIHDHPFSYREKQPLGFVSVSLGLATFPDDAEGKEDIIQKADTALYRAKTGGKNRVVAA